MSVIEPLVKKCHSHTIVWFGRVSYRKLKMTYEKIANCCPLCGHELEDACYYGSAIIQTDCHKPDYRAKFWMPLKEDGFVVWQISPKRNDW